MLLIADDDVTVNDDGRGYCGSTFAKPFDV